MGFGQSRYYLKINYVLLDLSNAQRVACHGEVFEGCTKQKSETWFEEKIQFLGAIRILLKTYIRIINVYYVLKKIIFHPDVLEHIFMISRCIMLPFVSFLILLRNPF